MAQAEVTIGKVCALDKITHGEEWIPVPPNKTALHRVIITLDRGCREWVAGETEASVQELINENSRPGDIIIYTDGSVVRGKKKWVGFHCKGEWTVCKTREPRV